MAEKSEDLNQPLANYSVFLRQARIVSRRCLFFLGITVQTKSEKSDEVARDYAAFVLVKLKALVQAIKISELEAEVADERMNGIFCSDWKENVVDELSSRRTLPLEDVRDLRKRFEESALMNEKWESLLKPTRDEILYIPGTLRPR